MNAPPEARDTIYFTAMRESLAAALARIQNPSVRPDWMDRHPAWMVRRVLADADRTGEFDDLFEREDADLTDDLPTISDVVLSFRLGFVEGVRVMSERVDANLEAEIDLVKKRARRDLDVEIEAAGWVAGLKWGSQRTSEERSHLLQAADPIHEGLFYLLNLAPRPSLSGSR